ncbi:tetratricopeptide repeat protein [Streptomyces sp. 110]|uniref:Tetratricopeptide repeat protein n=1 Tax=Streptomyces endocoffeicus TaxID=2898945 RepID=A0ABS1Q1L9_9ACTN|nr:tetratricopeptide repeat protein [Streptomyces endocoffeicus]MBL1118224.1 tetratricopeptide repeat protein [Streptomyces endocoffeicus]
MSDFTGREEELRLLVRVKGNQEAQATVLITGKPGVGKTTLAVQSAYQQWASYGDGDLYADLRGADKNPASPKEIMGRFLGALGVPEEEIPGDHNLRQDTYRRVLADRPLIIILDNAVDESQVRPLIPPGGSALVFITSRSQLSGLESVQRMDLEVFQTPTSLDFFQKIAGKAAIDKDEKSAKEIVQACGHLPLALRIAANRIACSKGMSLANLATELRDQHELLEALEVGDLAVRAAFNLSYRRLGKGAKNAFKRLSGVPAEDFGAGICSALLDVTERQASKTLRKLSEANLIEPSAKFGRFKFHDLLKAYSRELAEADSPHKSAAATGRMLDWLQNSSLTAHFVLIGQLDKLQRECEFVAKIESIDSATDWIQDELSNAITAIEISATRTPEKATAFALSLTALCEFVGNLQLWDDALKSGLKAATLLRDPEQQVLLMMQKVNLGRHRRDFQESLDLSEEVYRKAKSIKKARLTGQAAKLLGTARMDCGKYEDAMPLIEESLEIFKELGREDEVGQALYNLGAIHRAAGNITNAIDCFKQDFRICTEVGDEFGAAETANTLALAYADVGEFDAAEKLQQLALESYEKLGNPHKISMVCNDLGVTLRRQGKYEEGLELHLRDLELSINVGNQSGEAVAQANIAETLHALGRLDEAEPRFSKAISTLEKLGDEQRLARTLVCQIPVLFDLGKVDSAEKCRQRATDILIRYGQLTDLAEMHNVLANEYFEIGEYETSLVNVEEALKISQTFSNPFLRAVSLRFGVRSSAKLNRPDEVRRYSKDIQLLCSDHPGLGQLLQNATQQRYGVSQQGQLS